MKAWKHFCTIWNHKREVAKGCFAVGLYWQGIVHDFSKFSPEEFLTGARYWQGNRSPNARERELFGYSRAWLHHKGRNKHHYEYWVDAKPGSHELAGVEMPPKYFAEMIMDRIAASKTYRGKDYRDSDPLSYYMNSKDSLVIHPATKAQLEKILAMLAEKGEKATFSYIRTTILKK